MEEIDRIVQLLTSYWEGSMTSEMAHELEILFQRYPFLENVVADLHQEADLRDALTHYESLFNESSQEREQQMLERVIAATHRPGQDSGKVRRFPVVWKYAVAASLAVICLCGIWWKANRLSRTPSTTADVAVLAPGANKATLRLPDGRELTLSTAHEGIIAGEELTYSDHTPLLDESLDRNAPLVMTVPRGGQYQLLLDDGTKVWLNADSKLEYPPVFTGNQRMVKLEGEAYFEVAKGKTPFLVQTPSDRVEVLGTYFNVSAYRDDAASTVSLLQGKVKVSLPDATSEILRPGQQSVVKNNTLVVQDVDVNESIAWKNGEFMFNQENLDAVMQKLARWYDIEIEVAPELADMQIWGSLSRYDNFDEVLRFIKMTDDDIQFAIEGRRVTFMK